MKTLSILTTALFFSLQSNAGFLDIVKPKQNVKPAKKESSIQNKEIPKVKESVTAVLASFNNNYFVSPVMNDQNILTLQKVENDPVSKVYATIYDLKNSKVAYKIPIFKKSNSSKFVKNVDFSISADNKYFFTKETEMIWREDIKHRETVVSLTKYDLITGNIIYSKSFSGIEYNDNTSVFTKDYFVITKLSAFTNTAYYGYDIISLNDGLLIKSFEELKATPDIVPVFYENSFIVFNEIETGTGSENHCSGPGGYPFPDYCYEPVTYHQTQRLKFNIEESLKANKINTTDFGVRSGTYHAKLTSFSNDESFFVMRDHGSVYLYDIKSKRIINVLSQRDYEDRLSILDPVVQTKVYRVNESKIIISSGINETSYLEKKSDNAQTDNYLIVKGRIAATEYALDISSDKLFMSSVNHSYPSHQVGHFYSVTVRKSDDQSVIFDKSNNDTEGIPYASKMTPDGKNIFILFFRNNTSELKLFNIADSKLLKTYKISSELLPSKGPTGYPIFWKEGLINIDIINNEKISISVLQTVKRDGASTSELLLTGLKNIHLISTK